MRILYLDINADFVNPTRSLLPAVFACAGETHFFGPGYVADDVLQQGLIHFIERYGPFDVVAATPHVLLAQLWPSNVIPEGYRRHYSFRCPLESIGILPRMSAELRQIKIPRLAILLESDLYNWTEQHIDAVERASDFLVGLTGNLWERISDLPELSSETWGGLANDHWFEFIQRRSVFSIPFPHFVGETEICWDPLSWRLTQWSVPGAEYAARREAFAALTSTGVCFSKGSPLFILEKLRRYGLFKNASPLLMRWMKNGFADTLRKTRHVFTCGSGIRMPVRKFFEIPAAGAVLVCRPCNGFEALGFRDRVNAIVCDPKDLPDLHGELEGRPDYAQSIADAGRRLIAENHTVAARGRDLKRALEHILAGTFRGAEWHDGKLKVKVAS